MYEEIYITDINNPNVINKIRYSTFFDKSDKDCISYKIAMDVYKKLDTNSNEDN